MFENKWLKIGLINWSLMIFVYEFIVLKTVKPITHGNPELHKKYPGFKRNDAHLFRNRLLHWFSCGFFIPRFLLTALGMTMLGFVGWLTKTLKPKGQVSGDLTGLTGIIIRGLKKFWCRFTMFAISGTVWIRNHKP
jgi:hypothetical protein